MEDDPHQVLEGLIIAGWAIGASEDISMSVANILPCL